MTTIIEQMKQMTKRKRLAKTIILTAMLLLAILPVRATDYVFTYTTNNTTYYVGMNGANIVAKTAFDPTCVWTCYNGNTAADLQNSNTNLYALKNTNSDYYLTATFTYSNYTYNWTLSSSQNASNIWRRDNNNPRHVYARVTVGTRTRNADIYYNNGGLSMHDNTTNETVLYTVTINQQNLADNTTNPSIDISSVSNNTINLSHTNLTGTYTPAYTRYQFNSTNHYWYNNSDHTSAPSAVNANTLSPTYTWSLTSNGGGVATINSSTGVLTLSGAPTANITVRLTVSNISPLSDKTVDFTLTRANVAQNVTTATTLTTPTITPASASLNFGGNQPFAASATATTTTTTIPAHVTLTNGGTTYYYYNGTLYTSTSGFAQQTTTNPDITYSWNLTGAATSSLSPTSGTGSSITLNYNNSSATNLTGTLTVTATAGGQTKTQTATVTALAANPASITITTPSPVVVYVSGSGTVNYTLNVRDFYDNVTGTTSDAGVFTVGTVSGGTAIINPVAPGTATLTLTAHKTNGDPITPSAMATIKVKDKVATPEISFTQIGEGETATASISCATSGATIYFKVNSGSYSAYSPGLTVNENDVVYAYASMTGNDLWDDSDETHATYIPCKTPDPVITFTASGVPTTATVTITAETGATIYYTTNGDTPTTGSSHETTTVTINSVANETVVKAFAKNSTCSSSNVVTETIMFSGVSGGGVVTLYDYEDHNWTYYSGVPSTVDGGNYNTNYNGTLYSPNPRNVKITYDGNGGAVSIDESETEFVYYKTLEQGTTSGQYPYTVISNPFSKRPDGKGFGGWKIISGGDYIQGHSNNDVLALDEEITFVNLPYSSVNCTSAEIEFQATWVTAKVTYLATVNNNNNSYTFNTTNGTLTTTYENNFLVINRNYSGTLTVSQPVTILMVEPDGSSDYRNSYSFTGNITPNNNGVTKIEFTKWNSTNTLNCNNHSVTVGRGMTTTSQCASYVTGVTGRTQNNGLTTYSSNLNYHLKLESGTFTDVSFIAGTAGTNGYVNCNGTSNQIKGTLGNDYDRAKGDNTKLDIVDEIYLGYRSTYANGNQNNALFTCWVKSGNLCSGTNVTNTTFNNSGAPTGGYYGEASQCFYVSSAGSQTNIGKRKLYVEGGILAGIAGGIDSNNPSDSESFFLRMTGGQVRGVVYGSGAFAASSGIRRFIITGGTINGWVAAGCNGTDPTQSGGTLPSNTFVYVGGDAHVGNTTDLTLNTSSDGNVFGAGSGNSAQATTGQVNNSNVVIADECYVKRNVYGGGNYGYSNATATVYVTGGEVAGSVFGGSNQKQGVTVNVNMTGGLVEGGVYGGSNVTGTISQSVTMNINGGQVGTPSQTANIHGGGYGSATRVTRNVDITLGKSGQTAPGVTVYGDVYGGSALGYVNGTTGTNEYHTYVTLNKGIINGSLYGGGLGDGSTAANVYGPVQVKVYGGSVNKTDANGANGSGGVYGANNVNGAPQRSVTVDIYGTDPAPSADEYALFAVYGGGNQANYTNGNGYPQVTVHNCDNSIEYVYGGGNAAAVASTDVTIYGGNTIGNVFGGGNGTVTAANVTGNTSTKIYGGTIGRVFGGSNSQGTIGGTITVNVNKQGDTDPNGSSTACDMRIGELYGGGNLAASNVGSITIGCTGDLTAAHSEHPENIGTTLEGIGYVYGGANQANINGDITLTMNSGIVGNLFGGNNTSGTISGGIQVKVEKDNSTTCASDWYVGNVFGGGNLAQYTIPSGKSLAVNVLNGTVSGNVYGGGKGDPNDHTKGQVTGNPVVTIGDASNLTNNSIQAIVLGDVYGGGDAGNVVGTPQVNVINKCNTSIANVYGGGNAADVSATDVNIDGGTITGNVFGGGHGDKDATPALEAKVSGDVNVTVTGGTIHRVFGGSNSKGDIGGDITVEVNKDASSCSMKIDEVYGGGNFAASKAGEVNIVCTGTSSGEYIDFVYGGANQANITGNITLNITGGRINNAFGGNNTSGTIDGDIVVNVEWDNACTDNYLGNVYGGGNLAAYSQKTANHPQVNIKHGTVSNNVYGGGKGATAVVTGNPIVTIGDATNTHCAIVNGNVFGGGDAAAVTGNTVVTYNDNNASSQVGQLFGGGNAADVSGTTTVNMTLGKVTGGIYGGCNTTGEVGAVTVSLTGGQVGTSGTRADVFGGGFGQATTTSDNISVTLSNTTVYGDIYGGSAFGSVNASASNGDTITINGNNKLYGTIYGGGKGQNVVGNTITAVTNGNVVINYNTANTNLTGLYGGANINGNVKGDITVNVNANVGASSNSINVFGGGLGVATQTEGDVTVNFGTEDLTKAPVIYGNLYGGSSQGQVGSTQGQTGATNNNTTVYIYNGTVNGNVYGGGLGVKHTTGNYDAGTYVVANDSIEAVVNGNALVYIGTAAQNTTGNHVVITGNVFGGSDLCGNTLGDIEVHIYHTDHDADNTVPNQSIPSDPTFIASVDDLEALDSNPENYALQGVFGGGNLAHYWSTGSTSKKKALVYVHGCENSIQYLYGGGNAANTTADSIVIEGGRFDKIFGGGNGEVAALPAANVTNGNAATYIYGGLFNYIFGGSNTKGSIEGDMDLNIDPNEGDCGRMVVVNLFGGGNLAPCSGGELTVKCGDLVVGDVYGGANMATITGDVTLTIEGGTLSNVFGGSKGVADDPNTNEDESVAANIDGNVTLNLKGGTMINAFGGSDQKGNITGKITVNVLENSTCPLVVTNVYGGGNVTAYTPDDATSASPEVNIKHLKPGNSISGDVFGGGYGQTAIVSANPVVTIGDDIATDTATVSGNVYGGGSLAAVTGNTSVLVKNANTNVAGNVFGGGSQAGVSGTSTVQVANGSVGTGVYGGCNTSGTVGGNVTVSITGGTIGASGSGNEANVHGGGYGNGTSTSGNVDLTINGASAVIWGAVYGGSAKGHVNDAAADHTNVTLQQGTIHGDLYGGGLGDATYAALVNGAVQVTVNGGTVDGAVYGCNNVNGAPQSTVKVDIYGTDPAPSASAYALGSVFGGGNQAAYTYGNGYPQVTVHNCDNSIEYVYGGGNAAAVVSTDVKIYGGNKIGYVFGGGNGAGVADDFVMLSGSAVTHIYGGTILHVFAGNNTNGVITGTSEVYVNKTNETGHSACPMYIGEVYGGGNFAAGKAGSVDIGCTGDLVALGAGEHYGINKEGIQYVYGGANQADISNDISVAIHSGIVENVFGGNNQSGTISGTITVNIDSTGTCGWYVGNVYGGGNQATYGTANSDYPQVNILKGLVSGDVFGGGLGSAGTAGQVTGNPQVVVNGAKARVNGGVYGGGSLAPTVGNPLVTLTTGALTNVYGGGKAASITGAPTVNINGGTVSTGVYGGCDSQGNVSGDITVNVMSGVIGTQANLNNNILANVFGGGYGPATTTSGNVEVNIDSLATFVAPVIYGDVYGGSALGDVNDAATDNTVVNVLYGTLKTHEVTSGGFPVYHGGNVFGGGLGDGSNAAKVNGTVTVNIGRPYSRSFGDLNPEDDNNVGNAVIEGNVYGCNNTNGSPQDSVTVHIYRTHRGATDEITYDDDDATYALHNVFGGGNEADYIPATGASNKKLKVWIHDCYNSIERVFGGSNAAAAGAAGNEVTVHTNIDGGRFNNVFGGGNGEVSAADIHGDVKLEIHGGLVDEFYVGSNQRGTIYGSSTVTVDEISNCQEVLITEFFCGGKYANVVGNIEATIDCADALTVTNLYGGCKEADVVAGNGQPGNVHLSVYGGHYTNVFGGSKGVIPPDGANAEQLAAASADIDGNVVLDLYGGTIENVYGGSNINGNIKGTITVNVIDKEDPDCPLYITNIYGGSNETDYTPTYTITPGTERITPVVNVVHINSGIQGNIYGGSRGLSEAEEPTKVVACPQVNIGYDASMTGLPLTATYDPADYSQKAVVSGNVFGGGDAATVDGNTAIFLRNRAKVFGNVYGGGNKAEVTGNTKVIVNGQNN